MHTVMGFAGGQGGEPFEARNDGPGCMVKWVASC